MNIHDIISKHAAERPTITIRLCDFLACDWENKIRVRALSAGEKQEAAKAAVEFRKDVFKALPEQFRTIDPSDSFLITLADAESSEELYLACRDYEDPSKPAFSSAHWMRQNMTGNELQCLYGFYEKAMLEASKTPSPITEEALDIIQSSCAATAGTDAPDKALMSMAKPVLADVAIRLAQRAEAAKK